MLKPGQGSALSRTAHEQAQSNRTCNCFNFLFFGVLYVSRFLSILPYDIYVSLVFCKEVIYSVLVSNDRLRFQNLMYINLYSDS
jgi:hypothetical protein